MRILMTFITLALLLALTACSTTSPKKNVGDPLRRNSHILFRDLTAPYHGVKS